MAGQTRINGNLIDTGTDPEDIVSISTGDARYPKLPDGTPLDANQVAQGFIQREGTRGDLDPTLAVVIELNLIGYPVAGGYYAGLIDTTGDGSIQSNDDYQSGQRYALIVSDKSLEGGRGASPASGLPTGDLEWDTQDRGGEAGCFTRWNGLEATNVIIAKDEAAYEAHGFIADVRSQYPAPSTPGGSEWYLPAMDELELLYRNFKPNNADNDTRDFPRNFPGSNPSGTNPSSAIEGFQYENSPRIPDVTFLDLFKEGNAQAIDLGRYWSTTDADEGDLAWYQNFTFSGIEGLQADANKDRTSVSVRPVRRVVLDDSGNDSKNRSGNYNINGAITAHGLNTDGGDVSFTEDTGTTPKFFWDASAERLGIGTSSPEAGIELKRSNFSGLNRDIMLSGFGNEDGGGLKWKSANGKDAARIETVTSGGFNKQDIVFLVNDSDNYTTSASEAVRIDSDGNLLVGTTDSLVVTTSDQTGVAIREDGNLTSSRSNNESINANRINSDGDIIRLRKDGSIVGSIGVRPTNNLFIAGGSAAGTGLRFNNSSAFPTDISGDLADNSRNLGLSSARFDDIYATNGTIQTSDVNEKQDVEALSDAEARVAAKAKTLLRKYRWKSAVEEKGDDARIHFGIIAQDLEQAFIDEGLDAGRYGMFIRGEWYEAEVEKTRTVENDDGTETTETYMETETYESAEEAPADAVHKERLGVRYHELLAFIIAAI